jgi:hypothetical protein
VVTTDSNLSTSTERLAGSLAEPAAALVGRRRA